MILAAFILIGIASLAKAMMDEMSFHYDRADSIFYGAKGWFKYPNDYKQNIKNPIWRLLMSTVLVPFIDAWHFFQFLFLNCFFMAAILVVKSEDFLWPVYICAVYLCFHLFFEFYYTVTMKKNKFSISILIIAFLLVNAGLAITFSLQNWVPHVREFQQTWFKLMGALPAILFMTIAYIVFLVKKNKGKKSPNT